MKDKLEIDALLPAAMAERVEGLGVAKAKMGFVKTFVRALLTGAFYWIWSHFRHYR